MASLWNFFRKQEPIDASATVAMVSDMSTVQYPDDNYLNFAKEGYGKSELVHACIRELSTGVATDDGRWESRTTVELLNLKILLSLI